MEKKLRVINNRAFDKVKWAYQRLTRGWDDRAVWDMDYYLAKLIPQLVKELKEKGHGFPSSMIPVLIPEDFIEELSKETQILALKRWHDILDSIVEGFEEYSQVRNCMMHPDYKMEKFEKGFKLFKKYFGSLWD